MGHVIIEENLYDKRLSPAVPKVLKSTTRLSKAIRRSPSKDHWRERTGDSSGGADVCQRESLPAILWGMGVASSIGCGNRAFTDQPRDADRQPRQASAGVNPIRGQNNVQGARAIWSALPDTYPGFTSTLSSRKTAKFAKLWGVESLPAHTGYRISELRTACGTLAQCARRTI